MLVQENFSPYSCYELDTGLYVAILTNAKKHDDIQWRPQMKTCCLMIQQRL